MPGEAPQIAGKARHATALLQRYLQVNNEAEKVATVAMMNELFPDIRFRHQPKGGLLAYFLEGKVISLPRSLSHAASLILCVRPDGKALVQKDREGGRHGRLVPATDLLAELGGTIPRRSRWERIASGDDWI